VVAELVTSSGFPIFARQRLIATRCSRQAWTRRSRLAVAALGELEVRRQAGEIDEVPEPDLS